MTRTVPPESTRPLPTCPSAHATVSEGDRESVVVDDIDGAGDDRTAVPRSSVEQVEAYAAALRRAVVQALSHRPPLGGVSLDDVAQEVVLKFLENPVRIMATYREPWIYARASAASRLVDLGRRDRAQRGEGSRLVVSAEGARTRRTVIELDNASEDHHRSISGSVVDSAFTRPVEDLVIDRLVVDEVLSALSADERWLIECVDVWQYTVTEIAAVIGLSRETVSRRLSSLRRSFPREEAW